ncbi:hypothetical protein [Zobellia nedashkovskayae]|uniref:hypothetical protein n=1 Tax=Zobellia nedashkovskayae TaxID=2779510 RepID=UPI00188BD218|nr:hypothetical protein [Zobellia nedashkovskayae]
MSKKRLSEGDIFYVNVNAKYVFARLLLDVSNRILRVEPEHHSKFFAGCYLIEIYKGLYSTPNLDTKEIILPSQYTFKKYFYSKNHNIEWVYYNHDPVDYTSLDFPETLKTGENGLIDFRKFDLSIPTRTLFEDFPTNEDNGNQKFTATICGSYYQMVDEAFHLQNRDDLMRTQRTQFLNNNDIRLDKNYRERIYTEIGEDKNQSYYKMSLKHGFDLSRFY